MPIVTDGPALEPTNKGIDEFHVGRMESLGADIGEAVADLPTAQLFNAAKVERARGDDIDFGEIGTGMPTPGISEQNKIAAATPRIDIIDANDRVKKAGLAGHLTLPDQPDIPPAQLDIMMNRAKARREREATIERGPQGYVQSALGVGTSFLVGAVDPINIASAFIPVMGELRYAKILESAGEGFAGRMAVRAGVGAAQGAVGQAALEPLDWWSHTQEGRDFGMSDVLHNILFGAVLGGAMHAGGGAISDVWRARRERPLYPYDIGEPLESHTPWEELRAKPPGPVPGLREFPGMHEPIFPESPDDLHITPAALAAEHQASRPALQSAEVQTIDDLPQRAREDAARAGIANLIDGAPLRVGEMLEAAAKTDPRIAESFDIPAVALNSRQPRGRAAADPQTWSLYEFLAHEGGLKPDPELQAIFGTAKGPFVPGFGALVRPGGRTLDDALRLAKDHGYMFDAADVTGAEARLTPNDLLDRVAEENAGRRQYRHDQQFATKAETAADLEREKHEIITALHDEIEATTGQKGLAVDRALEDRVVQIITREGEHDVLAAYERAIMEDAERYEGLANERQNHPETSAVAAWDHPQPVAASRAGAADPRPRRQGRLSEQGTGGADGDQPRGAGDGDRAPLANALDRDAAWRRLSHADPEFDGSTVIAASNAAAEVKRPPTRLDERLSAAQKADAFAKEMYDMFAERLPEGDRQRLDDLIKTIDSDHEAREIAIQRGGACLFGARG